MLQGDQLSNSTEREIEVNNNRNQGRRFDSPWVLSFKKGWDCRYSYVQISARETLQPVIQREVTEGSIIHADELPCYATLNQLNFRHFL